MLSRNVVLTLLLGLVSAFGSSALAQGCGCAPNKKIEKKTEQVPVVRQKPSYEVATPVRDIAPRDLPVVYASQARHASEAAKVLEEFSPERLIRDAKAIAVIPSVKKVAFGFGARFGDGLISMRDERGSWIPPSYIHIIGLNYGFQIGLQSTDLVLVFTNEGAVSSLLRGKLTLNADASAAAGPLGRKAQVGVPILMSSGIYAFSRSRGLFAGVSLDGATITIDDTSNHNVYGKYISGDEILMDRRVEANTVVAPFLNALETYATGGACAAAQQDTTALPEAAAQNE